MEKVYRRICVSSEYWSVFNVRLKKTMASWLRLRANYFFERHCCTNLMAKSKVGQYLLLKIGLTFSALQTSPDTCANSADPDETAHNQNLHRLPFCFDFWLTSLFAILDMSIFNDRNVHFIERELISNQPNLFPVEIHLFFFDVIALYYDALRPTVFKCHQPRTENVKVLSIDPLLNCRPDFFIRPEMKSPDILFEVWE